ncbi:MAG: DUF559 domain-containing protein [Myxococcales bacterium]|nr:DUF559 domain-containing protein [Myxococcales bacterium]
MRGEPTRSEAALWARLSGSRLGVGFRRQHVIGKYIVDFAAPKARLVVEVDEGYHVGRARKDATRDARLARAGWRVLRVSSEEAVEVAVARVVAALAGRLRYEVTASPTSFSGPASRLARICRCAPPSHDTDDTGLKSPSHDTHGMIARAMSSEAQFLRSVRLVRDRTETAESYPFSLPAIQALDGLEFSAVTYLIGENGAGKSTVLEALAVAFGFNAEGGTINFNFATRASHSELHRRLRIVRGPRPATGFFLRAETFYNVATEIERLGVENAYGVRRLHEQSHGESFLSLLKNRFGPHGLYILDEPEAALSPSRQLSLLLRMHELVNAGSQFIIATHAPLVLAYPEAAVFKLDTSGISRITYDEAEQVQLTRDFLSDPARFLRQLFNSR